MRICQAYQENFSRNFVFILCVALLLHSCYNMENRYFLACKICCAAESRYFPQIGGGGLKLTNVSESVRGSFHRQTPL